MIEVDVLIVGGGPSGLMLAIELGRRGIRALLVDDKPSTAFNPQANATQARTMEHFRRLGFAHKVREQGLPVDYPTDIAYFTRFAGFELARLSLPSSSQAASTLRTLGASWSAAEMPHRISQKYVEPILRQEAEACSSVSLRFSTRMLKFRELADSIEADIENSSTGEVSQVRAQFLVGCDGARSSIRAQLGFGWTGDRGVKRQFMGGLMYAVYLRAPQFYEKVGHGKAWMYVTFNASRRSLLAAVDGRGEFAFHTQLREDEDEAQISEEQAQEMFFEAAGIRCDVEVLSRRAWRAGHALVAQGMQAGRVFLAGDAAHLFTPTGGLGYNTAIEDAVNLGWKLAAVINGQAGLSLLESYQQERLPAAQRNTAYARGFADSIGLLEVDPGIEALDERGIQARARASAALDDHVRREFNIPGITFGTRYDNSSVIAGDGSVPPPDQANVYQQSACPGGRAPHMWLSPNQSLFDLFGAQWTLLDMGEATHAAHQLVEHAQARGIELKPLKIPQAQPLYEASLALIRPDQVVAWRGNEVASAAQIWAQLMPTD